MSQEAASITSVLAEDRTFPPPEAFREKAHITSLAEYESLWKRSVEDPERFWGDQARSLLTWHAPFQRVLDWRPPHARWFEGGALNVSVNCVDRHVAQGRRDKVALIWEGEPGEVRRLTYGELLAEVSRAAHMLSAQGLKAGDRVTMYMPMCPEVVVAMLACARLGLVHSVVFAGFSAEALAERVTDAQARLVITADGLYRRGDALPLKKSVDEALTRVPHDVSVIVVRRTGHPVPMTPGRDQWWDELMAGQPDTHEAQAFPSEHPLFILYTSGSTGKPKGVLHTSAGYLLGTQITHRYVFDAKEDDVYWCTADVGWVTGHSYVVYGPLANGATVLIYEGAPNHPDPSRFWRIIARHRVSVFYTAPTAIRSFIKWGDEHVTPHDLSSLRLLGTVGEPINPEAWMWYRERIGGNRCPIVDTWWQTETGAIMIAPLPGATPTKPGTATRPFFGIAPSVVDKDGKPVPTGTGGFLVIDKPWPAMMRTIYGDDERFHRTYWEKFPGRYLTGDGARVDADGNYWILGRIDDVLNVAGHRLSTMEIESALVASPGVAEAAVVGRPDPVKGEAIVAFVTLAKGTSPSDALRADLKKHVTAHIGALARPDDIRFTDALPKTRSGKIMRRLLRDVARGQDVKGDTSTLEDFSVLARLREDEE